MNVYRVRPSARTIRFPETRMLHRRLHLSSFPALLCGLLSIVIPLFVLSEPAHAATGGSISGVVADQSGAVIPRASLTLTETSQETTYHAVSNEQGDYTFPSLPVGHYDLSVKANRFATQRRMNLAVDADSALRVDVVLSLDPRTDTVSVVSNSVVEVDDHRNPPGRSDIEHADERSSPERPQLYGSARDSTRSDAGLDARCPALSSWPASPAASTPRATEPRKSVHQRPARILQRIHGQRNRRAGAHERRHLHHSQP